MALRRGGSVESEVAWRVNELLEEAILLVTYTSEAPPKGGIMGSEIGMSSMQSWKDLFCVGVGGSTSEK